MKVAYDFIVLMAMMVGLAYAVKWGHPSKEVQIPPAPTCETLRYVPAGQPEWKELEKACRRLTT
jgi:hypothetical protein